MKLKLQHYFEIALVAAAMGFAYYNSFSKEKQIKKLTEENNDLSSAISKQKKMIEERDKKIVSLEGKLMEQEDNHKQQQEKNLKQNQESIKNIIQEIKNCIVVDLNLELKLRISETLKYFCQEKLQEEQILNDQVRRIK